MRKLFALALVCVGVAGGRAGAQQVVINEVDYDQVGTDTTEFVELRNNSACVVDLTNIALAFINGANNTEYRRTALGPVGTLQPGQYLVVGSSAALVFVAAGVPTISFGTGNDYIQNGAPDGIAVIDTVRLVVLDSLSYEGAMTAATIVGFPGTVNLVHGTSTPVADNNTVVNSLARFPDGAESGDDASDWVLAGVLTPGASNGGIAAPLRPCCGSADYNCDGDIGTDADIEAFFACLSGRCPTLPCTSTADFNGDGDIGTDADIESFFRVLAGGSC